MNITPKSRLDWLRAYFVGLESLCASSSLATYSYGDWQLWDPVFRLVDYLAFSSVGLLLLSSLVVVFLRWRLAVIGFAFVGMSVWGTFYFDIIFTFGELNKFAAMKTGMRQQRA